MQAEVYRPSGGEDCYMLCEEVIHGLVPCRSISSCTTPRRVHSALGACQYNVDRLEAAGKGVLATRKHTYPPKLTVRKRLESLLYLGRGGWVRLDMQILQLVL
jgi:hypothetical protein